jgi:hypothetical protein
LPGEHPLRCWHVLAAVQPAERLQHPGEMGIRPEQAGFDVADVLQRGPGPACVPGPAYCWPTLSSVRLGLAHAVDWLRDVRCTAGQDDEADRHDSQRDCFGAYV